MARTWEPVNMTRVREHMDAAQSAAITANVHLGKAYAMLQELGVTDLADTARDLSGNAANLRRGVWDLFYEIRKVRGVRPNRRR